MLSANPCKNSQRILASMIYFLNNEKVEGKIRIMAPSLHRFNARYILCIDIWEAVLVVIVWQLDFQLSMQSVCDNVFSELPQVGGFPGFSGFLHQQYWPPRYNWNIAESGFRHHNTKPNPNPNHTNLFAIYNVRVYAR